MIDFKKILEEQVSKAKTELGNFSDFIVDKTKEYAPQDTYKLEKSIGKTSIKKIDKDKFNIKIKSISGVGYLRKVIDGEGVSYKYHRRSPGGRNVYMVDHIDNRHVIWIGVGYPFFNMVVEDFGDKFNSFKKK